MRGEKIQHGFHHCVLESEGSTLSSASERLNMNIKHSLHHSYRNHLWRTDSTDSPIHIMPGQKGPKISKNVSAGRGLTLDRVAPPIPNATIFNSSNEVT